MAAKIRRQYAGAAAQTSITSTITAGDTSVSVASTTGWPSTASVPFYVVIDPDTSVEEKCSVTISGSTLTLTRGVDGTVAAAHASGATIYPVFTATDADEANELASKYTAKGDLVAQGASTFTTVAVGSNGQLLKADSSAGGGVSWATYSPTITLGGDLSGSVTLTDLGSGTLTATVAANSVALGTDTTGNYVATIAGTTNQVSVSGSGSESAAVTLSTPQDIHTGATPTFAGVIVGGSSVVANGIYLPAANTVGLSTNTTERMRIDSTGAVGIGTTPAAGRQLVIGGNLTGSTLSIVYLTNSAVQSDVTSEARIYASAPSTQATSFTLTGLSHFFTNGVTVGSTSTVTNQYGFYIGSGLTGATNNFGFYGNIAAATGRYNLYMGGTAANYMAGRLGVGATLTSGAMAQVTNTTAADKAFVVKGAASQSGTLLEIQNSAGTVQIGVGSEGALRINTNTDVSPLAGVTPDIQLSGTDNTVGFSVNRFSADTVAGRLLFVKSRNTTVGSHTVVDSGDTVMSINVLASDGTSYIEAARILAQVDGTPGTNDMPGRIIFQTTADGASSPTERMRIDSSGQVGIGATPAAGRSFTVGKNITGGTLSVGILSNGVIQSDVTSESNGFRSGLNTAAASFTLQTLQHFLAAPASATVGSGSTITTQIGFGASGNLTGATNNYGFYGDIASASGRWNFYANGTARNYFAGGLEVVAGTTSMTTGFTHVPAAAGTPTGAPTNPTGNTPLYYDTTNNKLYVYNGAWKSVSLT